MPNFELLDSESTHHHLPISKKIHRETFFFSQSMLLPLVMRYFVRIHALFERLWAKTFMAFFGLAYRVPTSATLAIHNR